MLWNEAVVAGRKNAGSFLPLRRHAAAGLCFLVCCCFFMPLSSSAADTAYAQLEKRLESERRKATARQNSLERLTEEERRLNADLAKAEQRIIDLERGIATHQDTLEDLARTDEQARQDYEVLLAEQKKTEDAQQETLRLLWDITSKRLSVGNRELADWAVTDREYRWSVRLFAALEKYRLELDAREAELASVLGWRQKLSNDMKQNLASVNKEKAQLLQMRITYGNRLDALREKKTGAEEELQAVLSLVDNLQLQMDGLSGDIENSKGRLPWPVRGTVQKRYNPKARPPYRGLGIATAADEPVLAVASGQVVHSGILRGFGTVVLVQHGETYYSLYAFLETSSLKIGDPVGARQVIGKTGYYPDLQSPGLHFELRLRQNAVNPEPWFVARE